VIGLEPNNPSQDEAQGGLSFAVRQKERQMKTYMAIKAEIAKLEKQAQAARKAEVAEVISKIKHAIAEYGISAEDLGFGGQRPSKAKGTRTPKASSRPQTGTARYRDPATGKTWTGQGRPPAWIAGAKDRDAFLIGSATAKTTSTDVAKPTRKSRSTPKRRTASTRAPSGKARRIGHSAGTDPAKTAATQVESGVAIQ